MATKKNPRWRVEVTQLSEERLPTWWDRLLGDPGNISAWQAEIIDTRAAGIVGIPRWEYGTTRDEAAKKACLGIADIEAREKMIESREVFYVEGS